MKWGDGSHVPRIKWGFSYSHYGLIEENTGHEHGQLPHQHCFALEVFPDHSHVSLFSVDCSVKYTSRVQCDDRHKATHTSDIEGLGEYWIKNSSLIHTDYMCPEGFNFVLNELCISLRMFHRDWLDEIANMPDYVAYENFVSMYQMCAYVDNNNKTIVCKDVDISIPLLHIMVDILEEYYPEGSDIYQKSMLLVMGLVVL